MGEINVVAFAVCGRQYALPLMSVERVVLIADLFPLPDAPPVVRGLLDFHGAPIPVFDLHYKVTGQRGSYGLGAQLIVGTLPDRHFAVAAEAVAGVRAIPEEDVAPLPDLLPGTAMLAAVAGSDAGLLFIYDPEKVLTAVEQAELDEALRTRAS